MLQGSVKPTRPSMIHVLRKYTNLDPEKLAEMGDEKLADLAARLKHATVVSDGYGQTLPVLELQVG